MRRGSQQTTTIKQTTCAVTCGKESQSFHKANAGLDMQARQRCVCSQDSWLKFCLSREKSVSRGGKDVTGVQCVHKKDSPCQMCQVLWQFFAHTGNAWLGRWGKHSFHKTLRSDMLVEIFRKCTHGPCMFKGAGHMTMCHHMTHDGFTARTTPQKMTFAIGETRKSQLIQN